MLQIKWGIKSYYCIVEKKGFYWIRKKKSDINRIRITENFQMAHKVTAIMHPWFYELQIWCENGVIKEHIYLFLSSSVHHAYLYLHVGLAGSYSLHLSASLHVFQHLEHLSEQHCGVQY